MTCNELCNARPCYVCEARHMLGNGVVAVLVGPEGIIKTYTAEAEAEVDSVERRRMNPRIFLIRGYIPEHLKSYNLVKGEDIPL